jgi:hypothetical protein
LTWGQKAILQDMQETGNQFSMQGRVDLLEGSTIEDAAARVNGLLVRHAALRMRLDAANAIGAPGLTALRYAAVCQPGRTSCGEKASTSGSTGSSADTTSPISCSISPYDGVSRRPSRRGLTSGSPHYQPEGADGR